MSRDAQYQSQIEDEYNELVMKVEFIYDILKHRMGNFGTIADLETTREVNNYAKSLAEDTQELIDFLKEKDFVSNT